MDGKKELKTLDFQSKLPSLPLPSLHETCAKYLESVKPFVEGEDYKTTEELVQSFENGVGKVLQEKLVQRAKVSRNWLQDWWYDSYLDYRGPSPVISNTAGGVEDGGIMTPVAGSQFKVAANWIFNAVKIFVAILKQEVPIQYLGRKIPLDMSQFLNFFCAGRIPGEPKDTQVHFIHAIPKDDGSCEVLCNIKHIVVLIEGRIFKMDVFDKNDDILKPPAIERELLKINQRCKELGEGPSVGWLTGADRSTWCKAYRHLCSVDRQNKVNINAINEAIFAFTIENHVALYNLQDTCEYSVLGDCGNRWLDKSLNEIIVNTGMMMSTEDHVHADGNVAIGLLQNIGDAQNASKKYWEEGKHGNDQEATGAVELPFVVDDYIRNLIEETKVKHRQLTSQYTLYDEPIYNYGKDFAKSIRIHPDTLVQMAVQLGYYTIHKKCASVYESGTTRMFYHGRTETVRSCSLQVKQWVQAMCDGQHDHGKQKELLFEAVKKQDQLMGDACQGKGIDRHLYGLRKVAAEEGMPIPEFFKDKAWELSGGFGGYTISSSLSGYFAFHGGLSPMVIDGYGCFYTIEPKRVNICVVSFKTSKVTNCKAMHDSIVQSFHLIETLLHNDSPKL